MTEQQKHLRQIALELAALLNHDMTPEQEREARDKARALDRGCALDMSEDQARAWQRLTGHDQSIAARTTSRRERGGLGYICEHEA